jgi:nucleotide-binding universal stress UspA family protein
MTQLPDGPVVLGVDGSPACRAAIDWAARFATQRGRRLNLVHVQHFSSLSTSASPGVLPLAEPQWRPIGEQLVSAAVEQARAAAGTALEVTGQVTAGYPASVLIEESDQAGALVVGRRGLGGFTRLLVGSVSVQVTAHALCPVIVVPPDAAVAATGPIVVGVDGSDLSRSAVGFGFEEASLRGAELIAVSAWTVPTGLDLVPLDVEINQFSEAQDRALAETLAGYQEQYPDVTVHREVLLGSPAQLLLAAAEHGQLIVVGSRGRGGFTGLLLGSVSQTVLHHAHCPVAILKNPPPRR